MIGFASCFGIGSLGCAHGSYVPRCDRWSMEAEELFLQYVADHGSDAFVRAVLRDAQVCQALAEIR